MARLATVCGYIIGAISSVASLSDGNLPGGTLPDGNLPDGIPGAAICLAAIYLAAIRSPLRVELRSALLRPSSEGLCVWKTEETRSRNPHIPLQRHEYTITLPLTSFRLPSGSPPSDPSRAPKEQPGTKNAPEQNGHNFPLHNVHTRKGSLGGGPSEAL